MAKNFKIRLQHKNGSLHMQLNGDFDGSSAYELLYVLKEHWSNVSDIIINTNYLKSVYNFGLHIWKCHLQALKNSPTHIKFTGNQAHLLTLDDG